MKAIAVVIRGFPQFWFSAMKNNEMMSLHLFLRILIIFYVFSVKQICFNYCKPQSNIYAVIQVHLFLQTLLNSFDDVVHISETTQILFTLLPHGFGGKFKSQKVSAVVVLFIYYSVEVAYVFSALVLTFDRFTCLHCLPM